MMKDQIAAGNLLFSQQSVPSNIPLNVDTNASQLALLQSFTSEMTIPNQAQFYHQQQQQQMGLQQVKSEINNNGDEQAVVGGNRI